MKLRSARLTAFSTRLAKDTSALALIEFAFVAPIIMLMGFAGLEAANFAMVQMRLNQAAVHVADNASRLGETDALNVRRVYEADLNDLFIGVDVQFGEGLDLYENGRVVLTSLEQNPDGGQWIHWQRCKGKASMASAYGAEGTGDSGTGFPGMGPTGAELTALSGEAVMYVEIFYEYQPIVGNAFSAEFGGVSDLKAEAAFNVRSTRDLSGLFTRPTPVSPSTCDKFEGV